MESSLVLNQVKIQQLFTKFLDPQYEIKNDTYLNRLLTHLGEHEKREVGPTLADLPIFVEWLIQAEALWDSNNIAPSPNIVAFTLNLTALLSKNEGKFCRLKSQNFYEKLINVVKARQDDAGASVKLGYIKLLGAFLEHKSGIQWIITSSFWEDCLRFSLTNQTVYITREGHKFMSRLLEQTIDYDEQFCNNVVKQIMGPLGDDHYNSIINSGSPVGISEEIVYKELNPTLELINNILEYFLQSVLFAQKDCRIVSIFLKDYHLEQKICNFMIIAHSKYLIFDLGKIMFMMQFLEMYMGVILNNLKMADVKTAVRKIMSIFSTNISKGNYENVMKFCYYGQFYWNLMGYKIPCVIVNKDNEPISFANQLIVLQMLPIFTIGLKYCQGQIAVHPDEFREHYIQKLFNIMCENTVRIAYSWRDYLTNQSNLFEIATKGLTYIMKSRKYYPRQRAAMLFQSFVYALKDVVNAVKDSPEKLHLFSQEVNFFSLLFDAFIAFIEEFQITWRDSVETICVMSISFDFLTVPTWPTKLVMKALKLVNISIAKYMSPNLALLVDRTTDSTMALLGPLLHTKLHDSAWEVRDTALEVVCTISHMSNTKIEGSLINLPLFQEWIVEAISVWNKEKSMLPNHLSTFTLNLASLLSKIEPKFCVLNTNNFYIKLLKITQTKHIEDEKIQLAYIKLLNSFLEHQSGIEFVMASNFWEDILKYSLTSQNFETITNESRLFIAKFLEITHEQDVEFCKNICRQICQNGQLCSLQTISKILQMTIERNMGIALIFLDDFKLKLKVLNLMKVAEVNSQYRFEFDKILFLLEFVELSKLVEESEVRKLLTKIENLFSVRLTAGDFFYVSELCTFGQFYWDLIQRKFPKYDPNIYWNMSITISFLNFVAPWVLLLKYCYTVSEMEEIFEKDIIRESYLNKCQKFISEKFVRICYKWRDDLQKLDSSKLFELASKSITETIKSYKYFQKEIAEISLQDFIYFLKDFMESAHEHPEQFELFVNHSEYFALIFETVCILIEEFNFNWQNSVELIDITTISFDFLTIPLCPPNLVEKALKLLNISIIKYMSPNLALLVDRTKDSTIALLGPLLYAKLYDQVGSVKKIASEIVYNLTKVTNSMNYSLVVFFSLTKNEHNCVLIMELNVAQLHQIKIENFLEHFLISSPLKLNVYLDIFLTYLANHHKTKEIESTLISLPIFPEWIKRAVQFWKTNALTITLSPTTANFTLLLASFLSIKEDRFCQLNTNDFYQQLIEICNVKNDNVNVNLAYIKLVTSLLHHKSGVQFLINNPKIWGDIFLFSLKPKSSIIFMESHKFMAKLLESGTEYNLEFCHVIVNKIMIILDKNMENHKEDLSIILQLIGNILEYFLESSIFLNHDLTVPLIFHQHFHKMGTMIDFLVITHDKEKEHLVFDLGKIVFIMKFLDLYVKLNDISWQQIQTSVTKIRNLFVENICKGNFQNVMKFCDFAQFYWNLIGNKLPDLNNPDPILFANEFVGITLLPNFLLIIKYCYTRPEIDQLLDDDFRGFFMSHLFRMMGEKITRIAYIWRDFLLDCDTLFDVCHLSLLSLKKTRKYFPKDRAALIFVLLIYNLKDFLNVMRDSMEKLEFFVQQIDYFSLVFEILAICILEFQITWRDSVEIIDVMSVALDFITITKWPTQIVVNALKLIDISINKYMSPNLALLVDKATDSTMADLGPFLRFKLNDEGEVTLVKNGCLEILCSMGRFSNKTSLQ